MLRMKVAILYVPVFLIFINGVFGYSCPRTNKKPGSECIDECQRSIGCSDRNKVCLCDGDCGYSCVKKSLQCTLLKKPRNGKIIGRDRSFNSTVRFECDSKYTLFGPSTRRCRAKGLWDGRKPRCKISCPDPGTRKFTRRNRKKSLIGFPERTTLTYVCSPGYTTRDPIAIKCQKNGKWSSPPPVCAVPRCGRVKLPPNSQVRRPRGWKNKAFHQYGTVILLTCLPGFRSSVNVGGMQCSATGWRMMRARFACSARSCGDPGTPRNGKKLGLVYTVNKVVDYECNNCYKLTGVSYRRCLPDGSWSDKLPTCTEVECPYPSPIANGKLSLSSQPINCGSYVEYKCAVGYKLKGTAKRTCLSDGMWSNSKPVCEIVDCGHPGHPTNGLTTARDGFTYGNDVRFSCNDNYVLEGSLLATCESDGKWSKSIPRCLEKCSDPSRNSNARVVGNEFYHGKEVQFVCQRSFILVPASSKKLTCRDGKWRGTIPTCKAPCSPLPRLSNGLKYGRSLAHGSVVRFNCYRGYERVGLERVQCNDGRWSAKMPRCLAICNEILNIKDGWVNGVGNLEGDVLSFRCKQNYVLEGAKAIKCIGKYRWNATKPSCRAPCRNLRAPVHGSITKPGFKHNEIVQFECDPDYHLEGRDYLTCRDGRWSGYSPKCLAPCRKFGATPFTRGYLKRNGFRHNEEVTFACEVPFILDGQKTLRCNDGRWSSNQLPSCGGPCNPLNPPRNGKYIKNGYRHKETVKFGCNSGFQMVGTPDRLCNFGVWNILNVPRCEKKCLDPSKDTNAIVKGNEFYNGKEVEFNCPKDQVPIPHTSKKLTCVDGKWNGRIPSCKASCPALSKLTNGYIMGKNARKHGSYNQFFCNAGYQIIGASFARCNDGKWSEQLPRCSAICKNISSIKNGEVDGKGRLEGNTLSFKCDENYSLEGERVIRCTGTGKWNSSVPKCNVVSLLTTNPAPLTTTKSQAVTLSTTSRTTKLTTQRQTVPQPTTRAARLTTMQRQTQVKNCPDIPKIKRRKVTGSGVSPGSKRTFVCNKPFQIFGAREITCLNNGQWSKPQPTCKLPGPVIDCKVVGKIKGGFAKKNQSFHGGRVVFSCKPNYTMVGEPRMFCVSGKWSKDPPECFASCQKLGAPRGGFIQVNSGNKHKDVIVFGCNQNYKRKGSYFAQCIDGKWNSSPPTCEKI